MKFSSQIVVQHFNCSSMGTRFDFLTYGLDEDFFSTAKNHILNELDRIEQKYSKFDENSEIFKINRSATTEPVTTDDETIALLILCQEYYLKTKKLFDITVGKFTNITKVNHYEENCVKASSTEIPKTFRAIDTGADKIVIDIEASTVRFSNPQLSIDLGGIGKGYALEKIRQYCLTNRIVNALISFGDSSITTLGTHPHGEYWPIGIQHTFSPGANIHTFRLTNNSLSTSGNTPNNSMKYGSEGHVLNPLTGEFQKETKTVSVVSTSPIDAEVLSTSLFIASDNDTAEIISRFNPGEAIEVFYNQWSDPEVTILNHTISIPSKNHKT